VGQLPCIPIASSVTSYGRDLLFQTKAFVEKHYTIDNGFPANAEVRAFGVGFASLDHRSSKE
jgi:DNA polymerase delta subunit 1